MTTYQYQVHGSIEYFPSFRPTSITDYGVRGVSKRHLDQFLQSTIDLAPFQLDLTGFDEEIEKLQGYFDANHSHKTLVNESEPIGDDWDEGNLSVHPLFQLNGDESIEMALLASSSWQAHIWLTRVEV